MLLAAGASFGFVYDDDEIPEVTDRVARISDLSGDVQIKDPTQKNGKGRIESSGR